MAEAYEVEIGGQVYEVEADTPQQAATYARLLAAREQGTAQATAGAEARSNAGRGELAFMPGQRGAPTSVPVSGPEDLAELESGKRLGATTAGMAGMTALTGPGMLANPMAAVAGLAKSAAGGIAGGEVGGRLGGMFGLGEPGKAIGATVGGLAGPFVSPAKLMKAFGLGGGRGGALGSVLERLAGTQAPSAEAASVAAKKLELEAAKLAEKKLAREAATAARDRALKLAEERNALLRMRLESKAAPKAPKPRAVETEAAAPTSPAPVARNQAVTAPEASAGRVAVPASTGVPEPAADTATIVLKLQQQMGTSSGRKVVRELLAGMPSEQAAVIKKLLLRGQEHPATVLGALFDPTKSAVGRAARPGEELARLLGQI